jgi:hypothetical protein
MAATGAGVAPPGWLASWSGRRWRSRSVALADRGGRETDVVTSSSSSSVFAGFRFPREVISVAVRWYLRYGLSYRDVEELLAERGRHRGSRPRLPVGAAVHS